MQLISVVSLFSHDAACLLTSLDVIVKVDTLQVSNKDWDKCVEYGEGCCTSAAGEQLLSGYNFNDDDDNIAHDHDDNGNGNDNDDDDDVDGQCHN